MEPDPSLSAALTQRFGNIVRGRDQLPIDMDYRRSPTFEEFKDMRIRPGDPGFPNASAGSAYHALSNARAGLYEGKGLPYPLISAMNHPHWRVPESLGLPEPPAAPAPQSGARRWDVLGEYQPVANPEDQRKEWYDFFPELRQGR